jgi:hypothetical protein
MEREVVEERVWGSLRFDGIKGCSSFHMFAVEMKLQTMSRNKSG